MSSLNELSVEQIRTRLRGATELEQTGDVPLSWSDNECQLAGVLVPLIRTDDSWRVIYIRRALHERDHHSGQVAFAGGKHEQQDADLEATALREAHEEIGIHPDRVTVLGHLNYHYSITRFRITPVVAEVSWPIRLQPDASEVARVFSIPLDWLADERNYRIEQRRLDDRDVPVVFYDEYDGELLWGATARMTRSLIQRLSSTN